MSNSETWVSSSLGLGSFDWGFLKVVMFWWKCNFACLKLPSSIKIKLQALIIMWFSIHLDIHIFFFNNKLAYQLLERDNQAHFMPITVFLFAIEPPSIQIFSIGWTIYSWNVVNGEAKGHKFLLGCANTHLLATSIGRGKGNHKQMEIHRMNKENAKYKEWWRKFIPLLQWPYYSWLRKLIDILQ